MKLYTEEDLRKAYIFGADGEWVNNEDIDGFIKNVTPIELPSDEEIEKEAFQIPFNNTNEFYDKSFIKGAKWMKEQILNQNK